jgi:hypothetical protein
VWEISQPLPTEGKHPVLSLYLVNNGIPSRNIVLKADCTHRGVFSAPSILHNVLDFLEPNSPKTFFTFFHTRDLPRGQASRTITSKTGKMKTSVHVRHRSKKHGFQHFKLLICSYSAVSQLYSDMLVVTNGQSGQKLSSVQRAASIL